VRVFFALASRFIMGSAKGGRRIRLALVETVETHWLLLGGGCARWFERLSLGLAS